MHENFIRLFVAIAFCFRPKAKASELMGMGTKMIKSSRCRPIRSILAVACVLALIAVPFPACDSDARAYADEADVAQLEQDALEADAERLPSADEYASSSTDAVPADALEADHVPGELVVVYEDDLPAMHEGIVSEDGEVVTLEEVSVVGQEAIGELPDDGNAALVTLEDPSDESMAEAMEELSSLEGVVYVEPNYTYDASATVPNDPYADQSSQHLQTYQYYLSNCGITTMWDSAKANGNVSVAVIDTGCNMGHADLSGVVDRAHAYDAVSRRPLVSSGVANGGDAHGHGTNVCGVVASQADNGAGTAGTSWNAKLVPIRVFNDQNRADSTALISALQYVDQLIENNEVGNLRVVNMSLGGSGNSGAVQSWLDHLYAAHGVLNVAAGGNGDEYGRPITSYTYPSDYNSCIGVTSLRASGANSSWCDYNPAKDIAASGEGICTTTLNGSWGDYESSYDGEISGTSFSAPLVAGAAAAMFAKHPSASAYDVVRAMQQTAKNVPGQPSASGSAGALDAGGAVAYLATHISGTNPPSGLGTVVDYSLQGVPMYRLYNRVTSEHFYTASSYERDVLSRGDWNYEGVGWTAPRSGSPVYRLYNPGLGDHHYTPNYSEAYMLIAYNGWNYEGIGWYSGGTVPLYRQYNPGLRVGQHNYTASAYERDQLVRYHGWRDEGIGWYALK